jgi:hypothetical protein
MRSVRSSAKSSGAKSPAGLKGSARKLAKNSAQAIGGGIKDHDD